MLHNIIHIPHEVSAVIFLPKLFMRIYKKLQSNEVNPQIVQIVKYPGMKKDATEDIRNGSPDRLNL